MDNADIKDRVLMVIKKFHQDYAGGGAERSGYRLARALVSRGAVVDIIGARAESSWKRYEVIGDSEVSIRIRRLAHPRIRFLGTLIYNVQLFFRFIAAAGRYSCLHIHFASFEMMTAVIARYIGGVPVICKIACSGETGEIAKAKRRYFAPAFFFLLKRVDAVVALSEQIREELIEAGISNDRIRVIPNGIDPDTFHPLPEPEKRAKREELGFETVKNLILFTGRLTWQKGLDILLDSLKIIDRNDYLLILAGQGELESSLKKKVSELGLDHRVQFAGPVKDVLSLYQAADIFVLPSRQEGLSNSLLEAMSAGLKVVATDISGSSKAVEDGISGLLVPPEDSEMLAAALEKVMGEGGQIGANARERIISGYSVGLVADRYHTLYSDLSGS